MIYYSMPILVSILVNDVPMWFILPSKSIILYTYFLSQNSPFLVEDLLRF